MTASIQVKNCYLYVVLAYKDPNGKRRCKWISTGLKEKGNKMYVRTRLDEYIEKYSYLETGNNPKDVFFLDYLDQWSRKYSTQVQKNTWETYSVIIQKHIIPYFTPANYRLEEITPRIIYEFYEYLTEQGNLSTGEGLSTASVKKVSTIMNLCLRSALIKGMIPLNPTIGIPIPKSAGKKQHKHVCTTKEEAQTLLNVFKGSPYQLIVYMCLFYGLRKSEVLGLKWKYVDLDNNSFHVRSIITKSMTVIEKDSPKTEESEATYELLPDFRNMLLKLRAEQEEKKLLLGSDYHDSGYVFCKDDGSYYRPDCIYRTFVNMIKKAGLERMRIHDLRHSAASVLFDLGWDIEKVKGWLRHRDIETTSNIYIHYNHKHIKKLTEELKGLYEI